MVHELQPIYSFNTLSRQLQELLEPYEITDKESRHEG